MESEAQTRRQFCTRTCSVAALAALGGAMTAVLQGCGGGGGGPTSPGGIGAAALPTINGTVSGSATTVVIDTASPLASPGSLAFVRSAAGNYLVARTSQDGFSALTTICTHQNCTITGYSGQTFVCPCHGSQFDATGHVLGGPAPRALRQYATQFANNVLTISG